MKAITVAQPWAWAIIHGGKGVENRTQVWKHRGPLAIHAGCRWSYRGASSALVCAAMGIRRPHFVNEEHGPRWPALAAPFGAVLGIVDLVDVHHAEPGCCDSPWAEQQYIEHGGRVRRQLTHLVMANPQPIVPVLATGRLGLWTVPDGLLPDLEVS